MTAHNFKDLTGQKFGKLTVIKRTKNDKYGRSRWLCECECGGKNTVYGHHLTSGRIHSCGCLNYRKIKSNTMFRKIKRMTVDEMAEFLCTNHSCKKLCTFYTDGNCRFYIPKDCIDGIKQKLLQEMEE